MSTSPPAVRIEASALDRFLADPPTPLRRAVSMMGLVLPTLIGVYAAAYSASSGAVRGPVWLAVVAIALGSLGLYTFRWLPVVSVALAIIAWELSGSALFVVAVSYLLARRQPRGWWALLAVLLLLHPLGLAPAPQVFASGHALLPTEAVPLYACVTPALVGLTVRSAGRTVALARDRAMLLEDAASSRAAEAVAADRLRTSRELHDLLGQRLSSISLRSAALRAQTDDAKLHALAAKIELTSAESIEDLHFVIGLMRSGSTAPHPRPADINEAVSRARADGIAVDLEMHGSTMHLTAQQQQLFVAVVEEALHNARKHAPGAGVGVAFEHRADGASHLTIRNGPAEYPPAGLPSGGFGLVGAMERAAELGAALTATPTSDGGFVVELEVPA